MIEEKSSNTKKKSCNYTFGTHEEVITMACECFGMKLRLHQDIWSPGVPTRKLSSLLRKGTNPLFTLLLVWPEEERKIRPKSRHLRRRKSSRSSFEDEEGAQDLENTRGERMKWGWTYLGKKECRR